MYSPDNYYTHYDMQNIYQIRSFDKTIKIEPLGTCYVYDEEDLMNGNDLFRRWYFCIHGLKEKFPKSRLVKTLSSSLWGYLSTQNSKIVNMNDPLLDDMNLSFSHGEDVTHIILDMKICKNEKFNYYKLLDVNKPIQKYPFRLKSFITSFSRKKMMRTLIAEINKNELLRVNTDGFIFRNPYICKEKSKIETLIFEGKHNCVIKSAQIVTML
jgi:hypothetical protein